MIRHLSAASALCSLALLGGPALAESAGAPALEPGASIILAQHAQDGYGSWRGRRDWRNDDQDEDRDRSEDRGMRSGWQQSGPDRGDRRGGPQQQMMQMHQMMHRPPPPPPPHEVGLRIRMRRGDAAIDLRCPPAADYSSCISAVGQLIDKLGPGSGAGRPSTGPGGSPAAPAPSPETPSAR